MSWIDIITKKRYYTTFYTQNVPLIHLDERSNLTKQLTVLYINIDIILYNGSNLYYLQIFLFLFSF